MANLTPRQQRFVEEYLIDLNATQAAIRSGYSEKTADSIGLQLLRKTQVAEAIAGAKAEREERTKIDADYVLKRLVEISKNAPFVSDFNVSACCGNCVIG